MRNRNIILLFLLPLWLIACDSTSNEPDEIVDDGIADLTQPWETVTPAELGIQPTILQEASTKAATNSFGSLVVIKDGKLLFEEYYRGHSKEHLFDVRSVTKSIVSTLVGIAIDRGDIDSVGVSIAPALALRAEEVPEFATEITIRDLLTMSAGWEWSENVPGSHYGQWINSPDQLKYVLELPRTGSSGFLYNSGATYLLGEILEVLTGMTIKEYADRYLFDKIGIGPEEWEVLANNDYNGGAGIDLSARDLARFGQLFIQGGYSGTEQVLSQNWIDEATSAKYAWRNSYSRVTSMSYGYLWWTNDAFTTPEYFAWGFGGQYVYIAPAKKLVVVATTDYNGVASEEVDALALHSMNVVQDIVRQIGSSGSL